MSFCFLRSYTYWCIRVQAVRTTNEPPHPRSRNLKLVYQPAIANAAACCPPLDVLIMYEPPHPRSRNLKLVYQPAIANAAACCPPLDVLIMLMYQLLDEVVPSVVSSAAACMLFGDNGRRIRRRGLELDGIFTSLRTPTISMYINPSEGLPTT